MPPFDRFALEDIARLGREKVGNVDYHLTFAMRAKPFLAGVLVFDLKAVSVRTFNSNSHVRPPSRTAEVEKSSEPSNAAVGNRNSECYCRLVMEVSLSL